MWDPTWLASLAGEGTDVSEYIEAVPNGAGAGDTVHALRPPQSVLARLWRRLTLDSAWQRIMLVFSALKADMVAMIIRLYST